MGNSSAQTCHFMRIVKIRVKKSLYIPQSWHYIRHRLFPNLPSIFADFVQCSFTFNIFNLKTIIRLMGHLSHVSKQKLSWSYSFCFTIINITDIVGDVSSIIFFNKLVNKISINCSQSQGLIFIKYVSRAFNWCQSWIGNRSGSREAGTSTIGSF